MSGDLLDLQAIGAEAIAEYAPAEPEGIFDEDPIEAPRVSSQAGLAAVRYGVVA